MTIPQENKTKIAVLEEAMRENKEDHQEIKDCISKMERKMDKFIDGADKRYASKRTEQLFYTVLGALIVYIVYKVIDLI